MDLRQKLYESSINPAKVGNIVVQGFIPAEHQSNIVHLMKLTKLMRFFPGFTSKYRPNSRPYCIHFIKHAAGSLNLQMNCDLMIKTIDEIIFDIDDKKLVGLLNFIRIIMVSANNITSADFNKEIMINNLKTIHEHHKPYFRPLVHMLEDHIMPENMRTYTLLALSVNSGNYNPALVISSLCDICSNVGIIGKFDLSSYFKELTSFRYIYPIDKFILFNWMKAVMEVWREELNIKINNITTGKINLDILIRSSIIKNSLDMVNKSINSVFWGDNSLNITVDHTVNLLINNSNPWIEKVKEFGLCNLSNDNCKRLYKLLTLNREGWSIMGTIKGKNNISALRNIVSDWAMGKKMNKWHIMQNLSPLSFFNEVRHCYSENILDRLSDGSAKAVKSYKGLTTLELLTLFNVKLSSELTFDKVFTILQNVNNQSCFTIPLNCEHEEDAEDLMCNLLSESTLVVHGQPEPKITRLEQSFNVDGRVIPWEDHGIKDTSDKKLATYSVTDLYGTFTNTKKAAYPSDYGKSYNTSELESLIICLEYLIDDLAAKSSEIDDYDVTVKLRKEAKKLIEMLNLGYRALLDMVDGLNEQQKADFKSALYSMFHAGLYARQWRGPKYPYPIHAKDTRAKDEDGKKVKPEPKTIDELAKVLEYMESGGGENLIKSLPIYNYTGKLYADSREQKMNQFVRVVLHGDYCIRMASTILIGTAVYALFVVFNEELIPLNTKVEHIW